MISGAILVILAVTMLFLAATVLFIEIFLLNAIASYLIAHS